ncbi:MAG TPA: anti-sigma regulatory factor [Streptosporangiaceae bacterium]|nr:anti-sigma regulatory factor [Streptosporangiaceae bacterium]
MVTLSTPTTASGVRDMRWIRVEEASAVSSCRSTAAALAGKLGFPPARADQLTLAVTEAGSNLHKHAREGWLMLRISPDAAVPGIELVTIDSGPGLRDVPAALRDGHSTAGTLGIGLGAIRRLADFCDLYSVPGHGTALVARFWPVPGQAASGCAGLSCAGLIRPIASEVESGDAFAAVRTGQTLTAVLCDGLGHGPLAAAASSEAVASVLEDSLGEPAALLERVHRRLGRTRGGAVGIVQVTGPVARFAGLGNVAAWIISDGLRTGMMSVPGIAGHQARSIRQFEYSVPDGAAIIMHSDGLSSRWDIGALPRLERKDPLVIAAVLLAEAGIHRDDASVLVLRP